MIRQINPPKPVIIYENRSEKNILLIDRKIINIHPIRLIIRVLIIFPAPYFLYLVNIIYAAG